MLILGDLNTGNIYLDQNMYKHNGVSNFDHKIKDTADALGLQQLITEPTRISDNVENLRDLIFTSNDKVTIESGTLSPFAQLDHFPIYAAIRVPALPKNTEQTTKHIWNYSKMNAPLLTDILMSTDWANLLENEIHTATDLFISTLHSAARAAIPTKLVKLRRDVKHWKNTELKRNIRKRNRLFKIAKRTNADEDWHRWRYQRNTVTTINRRLKSQHLKSQVHKLLTQKCDPYKYHQTLRNITGRSRDDTIPPLH